MLPVYLAYDTRRNDPNDLQTQRFLDRGDWKGAIKFIERVSKKNDSVRLQINICLIVLVSGEMERTMAGWKTLRVIIEDRPEAIVDLEILNAIEKSVPDFLSQAYPDLLTNMWKRASNALPKNTQISDGWFDSCCKRKDFVAASTMSLRAAKTSDNKHVHHWRAVTCRYLDAQFGKPEHRQIAGGISLKLIDQCLKAIPAQDTESASKKVDAKAGKNSVDAASIAVQNAMDLRLVLRIYEHQDKLEEALAFLDDEANTGLRSKIGRGNWELALQKIKYLTKLNKHNDLWIFCYQLLCDAATIDSSQEGINPYSFGEAADDMAVWKAAVASCYELADPALVTKLESLFAHPAFQKRHRLLAGVDLSLRFENGATNVSNSTTSGMAIKSYLEQFIASGVAYSDLKPFTVNFTKAKKNELMAYLNEVEKPPSPRNEAQLRSWMLAELNLLKFKYTFEVSNPENDQDIRIMDGFAADCLALYVCSLELEQGLAVTERRTGDDAAILAACTLIHMYKAGISEAQLQATLVLEKLLQYSRHHYGAMVLLIRLYVRQGVFSKAYEYYQRLDLKNIQFFTESWILLNRVGTIFPYRQKGPNNEIRELLTTQAAYAQDKQTASHRLVQLYQSKENYIGLCGVYQFLDLCDRSVSKACVLAELSRFDYRNQVGSFKNEDTPLSRILTIKPNDVFIGDYPDLRSTIAFPDYEHPEADPIEKVAGLGPPIKAAWIEVEHLMFRWRRWLQRQEHVPGKHQEHAATAQRLFELTKVLNAAYIHRNKTSDMTRAELLTAWMVTAMSSVHQAAHAARAAADKEYTAIRVDDWILDFVGPYELCWTQCAMVIPACFEELQKHSEEFKLNPTLKFDESEWKMLHRYFKTTEILMVYPTFMTDMIATATYFRRVGRTTSVFLDNFNSLNATELEDSLRSYMKIANTVISNYRDGARQVLAHWQDGKSLTRLVDGVLHGDPSSSLLNPLGRLLDDDWTRKKCLDVIRGWQDSMKGIEMEGPDHWWKRHWHNQTAYR